MIVTRTPLRISFAGGGTDFTEFYRSYGGAVLSSAIDKYVYVIVQPRFDDQIYVSYSKKEIVSHADEVQHDLVRCALQKTGVKHGVEIAIMADIPSEGSGLGSSSSLTVGLLNALWHHQGIPQSADWLAREACEIEIGTLGNPIGRQDQYIAAYGGLRHFQFNSNGSLDIKRPKISDEQLRRFEEQLLLFFTGITRKSGTILTEQKAGIRENAPILCKIRDQVHAARHHLEHGEFRKLGWLLHEGWLLKRQLAGSISTPFLDQMYDTALECGATGGKISGAGGGGFFLVHCTQEYQPRLRSRMLEDCGAKELPFNLERDGSKVIFNCR